jgi:hypothetical protein
MKFLRTSHDRYIHVSQVEVLVKVGLILKGSDDGA